MGNFDKFYGTPIEIIAYYVHNCDGMIAFARNNFRGLITRIINGSNITQLIELSAEVDEEKDSAMYSNNEKALNCISDISSKIEGRIIDSFGLLSKEEKQASLAKIAQKIGSLQTRLGELDSSMTKKQDDKGNVNITQDTVSIAGEQLKLEKYLQFYQQYYTILNKKAKENQK